MELESQPVQSDPTRPFAGLRRALLEHPWPEGGRVTVLERVDSTSDWLKRQSLPAERAWLGCVARMQASGRGRGGHRWSSAADAGLWCSVRVPVVPTAEGASAPLSLVLAGGVIQALAEQGVSCGLKWPNDLWLNQAKVGGLLVEQLGPRQRRDWIAGLGLNWRPPVDVEDKTGAATYPVSGLEDSGVAIDRVAVATAIIERMVEIMQQPETWPDWMAEVARADVLLGRTVEMVAERRVLARGQACGIAADGRLVLRTATGEQVRFGGAESVRLLD